MALERRTYTGPAVQAELKMCCLRVILHGSGTNVQPSRRVAVVSREASGVSPGGAATGADLGGSSNYSSENLEGRSGEGFHGNSSWPWVRRS